LKTALGQHARGSQYVYIGITNNPQRRFSEHQAAAQREDPDYPWDKMVIIYKTASIDNAKKTEKALIEHARNSNYEPKTWNWKGGGGGKFNPTEVQYVYVLLA